MTGGEENHIVMNERVQALAGSIYEVIKYSCTVVNRVHSVQKVQKYNIIFINFVTYLFFTSL